MFFLRRTPALRYHLCKSIQDAEKRSIIQNTFVQIMYLLSKLIGFIYP